MASRGSYVPNNAYSNLMYGNPVSYQGTGSSGGSSGPKTWTALPSASTSVNSQTPSSGSNWSTNDNTALEPKGDKGGLAGSSGYNAIKQDKNDFGSGELGSYSTSNPYADQWSQDALKGWGLDTLKTVGMNTALLGGIGQYLGGAISWGDAFQYGLSQGLSPNAVIGGLGNVLAETAGLPRDQVASMVLGGLGSFLGGPIGGLVGGLAAPFVGDAVRDAFNMREYEAQKDIMENNADGYFSGRQAGKAYTGVMNQVSNIPNTGISMGLAAAAHQGSQFAGMSAEAKLANDIAVTRAALEQAGYRGWEAQALMDQYTKPEDFINADINIAALAAAYNQPYTTANIQSLRTPEEQAAIQAVDTMALAASNNPIAASALGIASQATGIGGYGSLAGYSSFGNISPTAAGALGIAQSAVNSVTGMGYGNDYTRAEDARIAEAARQAEAAAAAEAARVADQASKGYTTSVGQGSYGHLGNVGWGSDALGGFALGSGTTGVGGGNYSSIGSSGSKGKGSSNGGGSGGMGSSASGGSSGGKSKGSSGGKSKG